MLDLVICFNKSALALLCFGCEQCLSIFLFFWNAVSHPADRQKAIQFVFNLLQSTERHVC